MLTIEIPTREFYNELTNEFVNIKGQTLKLEHSLVSISKWEAKWNKPFIGNENISPVEMLDYIRCMTIGSAPDLVFYQALTPAEIKKITDYIDAPMTATTFSNHQEGRGSPKRKGSFITNEIIYYDMISYNIPMECEKWHLNRLLTLIKVCSIKNSPPKKMSKNEIRRHNTQLNAQRRAKLHSKG